jgi:hypothetical protein
VLTGRDDRRDPIVPDVDVLAGDDLDLPRRRHGQDGDIANQQPSHD